MAIRDCIAPDRHPRVPGITLPEGSIDTHVHVFEDRYRLSPARGYNPPESTLDDLKHLHGHLAWTGWSSPSLRHMEPTIRRSLTGWRH